jgi:NAD(P)H-dependent FMN reductase
MNIVAISGTSRPDNYTSRALGVVVHTLEANGATVTLFDTRERVLNFPGHPPTEDAEFLVTALRSAQGVVLATPEYHGTFAAMTKLVLENMGFPSALKDKPLALLGVAQGRIGAIKSLEHLRGACAHQGALVVPSAVSIALVQKAFDAEGKVTDQGVQAALEGLGTGLLAFMKNYVCPKYVLEAMVRGGAEEAGGPWTATL